MATLTSPPSRHVSVAPLDDTEVKLLQDDLFHTLQDIEPLLKKLEKQECPLADRPWDQCPRCLEGHPNHYPLGIVTKIRNILEKRHARVVTLFRTLAMPT